MREAGKKEMTAWGSAVCGRRGYKRVKTRTGRVRESERKKKVGKLEQS